MRDEKSAERRQTRTEDDADQDRRKSQESPNKTSPGRILFRTLEDKIQVQLQGDWPIVCYFIDFIWLLFFWPITRRRKDEANRK